MATAGTENSNHAKCDKLLASALKDNQTIHKLIDSIESLGCAIPKEFFVCRLKISIDFSSICCALY